MTSLATSQWAIHLVLVILTEEAPQVPPLSPLELLYQQESLMCFLGTECIPGLLEGILLSTCWLSHCFWLEQDLDIWLKASDQNNRRVSVALKKFSLHICNWDLFTHMLNLCYKQRNKFWPKGSSLGILQGHRLNTASQAALKD